MKGLIKKMRQLGLAWLVLTLGYAESLASFSPLAAFDLAAPHARQISKPLQLWATYYHVHHTKSVASGYALLTPTGDALGPSVSKKDWCYGALQGTIRIEMAQQAKVFNFAGRDRKQQVDCSDYFSHLPAKIVNKIGRVRFGPAQGPFGDGVQGMMLVPYRSIAVDQRIIPYGSVVYIPQARGVQLTLPNGQVIQHDGYFFAADTGSAIKQAHIDVFSGDSAKNPFANIVKSTASQTFTAFLVDNSQLQVGFNALHRRVVQ